jgi:hypothetical protein
MIGKNEVEELYPENLEDVSGGVIRDRTDVFPYECYDENTGEHIGSCWSIEEAEELCRSKSCSTNLIPVEQAQQLLQHMRKQRFRMRKKNN